MLLPLCSVAQTVISGKVLSKTDGKPIANASVFLSNATIGAKSADDGTFSLRNIKSGKYDLVVSVTAFESYSQPIIAGNSNIKLPDIILSPKSNVLNEVTIKVKHEPYRNRNLEWFKDEFLGTSYLAKQCNILNPDKLDLDYDDATGILTASSYDFLVIENQLLGYRIKYFLNDFTANLKVGSAKKVYYKGSVLYEEMKGTPSQEKRWLRKRQETYENSAMHFLRAAAGNYIETEGFRVFKFAVYANQERPSDSIINARIKLYKDSKSGRDSLSFWTKKSKLAKVIRKLIQVPLKDREFVRSADQQELYDLFCDSGALFVTYDKSHRFHTNDHMEYLEDYRNVDNSLVNFNTPHALFYKNGILADPYNVLYNGVWGRNRLADLLPVDYEPPHNTTNDDSTTAEKIVARLKYFTEQHVSEKSYLHFDKPYYAAGDTIYFKAYATLGEEHQLSNLSGILHVELINTGNKVDKSIKLQLTNGVGWGDFALPDSLPKGNYRVRAYTNMMRNEGDGAYFERTIPIGSNYAAKIPESSTKLAGVTNAKTDIQFFPEGGQMVTGIRSKLAFKAMGSNGTGADVKGVIIDNENNDITNFSSTHLGMGFFYLKPEDGKTYKAKITWSDGTQNKVDIPKAEAKGIILSVNNDSLPKASVRIEAAKAYYQENKNKDYMLVIYSGGTATAVNCPLDSTLITLDILKRRLHTGVATVTLFSPAGEPLCERLLFIQKYDQLNLTVNAGKTTYAKKEKIDFGLNTKTRSDEPAIGHFSVSVIDETKVPVDENAEHTIFSDLLLTSDLKGFIEQPNYYFRNITDKTLSDLDLVMLTHGYRRFEWKQVLNNTYPAVVFKPENSFEISGTATSLFGKPLAGGIISLIKMHDGAFIRDTTDNQGHFHFSNLLFTDSTRFMLQAINAKGKDNTKLAYNKDEPGPAVNPAQHSTGDINELMAVYLENDQKQHDNIGKNNMLKNITIKDTKINTNPISPNRMISPEFVRQSVNSDALNRTGGGPLSDRLSALFHGKAIDATSGRIRAGLVVIDGTSMPPGFRLDDLNAAEIETVDALYGPEAAIYGMRAADGVVIITTKQGKGVSSKDIASVGILPISPRGFYKAREFYSPKYDHPVLSDAHPDLRTTIFWKPEVITDQDGSASFNYYNADGPGTYRVVVEGIDEKGNIGRLVYRYKVK